MNVSLSLPLGAQIYATKKRKKREGRAGSERGTPSVGWRIFLNLHAGSWVTSTRRRMRSEQGLSDRRLRNGSGTGSENGELGLGGGAGDQ